MKSHIIIQLTAPPLRSAPPPINPRAAYADALIQILDRHIAETGGLNTALADRIERVLWGDATPHSE